MFLKFRKTEVGQSPVDIIDSIHWEMQAFKLFLHQFGIPYAVGGMGVRIDDKPRGRFLHNLAELLIAQMRFLRVQLNIRTVIGGAFRHLQRVRGTAVTKMRDGVNGIVFNDVEIRLRIARKLFVRMPMQHRLIYPSPKPYEPKLFLR